MRSSLLIGFVAAALLAAAGCGSSSGGGTGGANGTGGSADHGGASGGGGQGGVGAGGGSTDCNPPCAGQTVCVGSGTQGGAVFMAGDGGVCPAGRHLQGSFCIQDLTYTCRPIPGDCNGAATCACASSSLCASQQVCNMLGANEITCVLEAP